MKISQGRDLDLPVMTNLTSLVLNAPSEYLIHNFFDEGHFPKLKNLSFKNYYLGLTQFSTHINLWKPHRGVQSFTLTTRSYCQPGDKFGEEIIRLFPTAKKLELRLNPCNYCVQEFIESFEPWGLEEIKLIVESENIAAGMAGILRIFASFNGIEK